MQTNFVKLILYGYIKDKKLKFIFKVYLNIGKKNKICWKYLDFFFFCWKNFERKHTKYYVNNHGFNKLDNECIGIQ